MRKDEQVIFCPNCGTKNEGDAKFCLNCGQPLPQIYADQSDSENAKSTVSQKVPNQTSKSTIVDATTSRINSWTGGQGAVKVSLRDFFGQVFQSHSQAEAEEIFIAGTKTTTPDLADLADEQVQPWLFSRALVFTLILGALLWVLSLLNPRIGVTFSLDAALSVAVPVSALILFFEVNVYRNISFYQVIKITLVGGALSLIAAMILDSFLGMSGALNFTGALITGIAEELGKVLVAGYFIYRMRAKHIFNGMLIGAAVGSGFAAFENIMYMVDDSTGQLASVTAALVRSLFSISDHTEWCAIAAAALVMAKETKQLELEDFLRPNFLKFLLSVIVIHMLWDWDIYTSVIKNIILAVITWLFVFVLIHAGLREVKTLQLQMKKQGDTDAAPEQAQSNSWLIPNDDFAL